MFEKNNSHENAMSRISLIRCADPNSFSLLQTRIVIPNTLRTISSIRFSTRTFTHFFVHLIRQYCYTHQPLLSLLFTHSTPPFPRLFESLTRVRRVEMKERKFIIQPNHLHDFVTFQIRTTQLE